MCVVCQPRQADGGKRGTGLYIPEAGVRSTRTRNGMRGVQQGWGGGLLRTPAE